MASRQEPLNIKASLASVASSREMGARPDERNTPEDPHSSEHEQDKGKTESTPIAILEVTLKLGILLAAFAILLWALVRHGERPPNQINVQCQARVKPNVGFQGESDFYGLGIRIGLYLQWVAGLITNCFNSTEREAVLTAYGIFNLSITIAVVVRIFNRNCTFAVEMFVALTMFWGGLNIVIVPLSRGLSLKRMRQNIRLLYLDPVAYHFGWRLKWFLSLLNYIMSPVTIWFWARLFAVGQRDFAPTPGGSTFFFFAKIYGDHVYGWSIFMAVASAAGFLWFNYVMLPLRVEGRLGSGGLEPLVGRAINGTLSVILSPVWKLYALATGVSVLVTGCCWTCFRVLSRWIAERKFSGVRNSDVVILLEDHTGNTLPTEAQMLVLLR